MITSLELDFIAWRAIERHFDLAYESESEDEDNESTPLTDLIIPEREDDHGGFLPNLETLSLSASSFKGSWDRIIAVFNFRSVKALRLLNCRYSVEMLDYMAQMNMALEATKVELSLPRTQDFGMDPDGVDFLAPFDGLEDLFLMFNADYANSY